MYIQINYNTSLHGYSKLIKTQFGMTSSAYNGAI